MRPVLRLPAGWGVRFAKSSHAVAILRPLQRLRQLRDVYRDLPRFVARVAVLHTGRNLRCLF